MNSIHEAGTPSLGSDCWLLLGYFEEVEDFGTTVQGQMVLVVSHCVGKIMKVFGKLWRPKRPLNWLGFHIDTRYLNCFLGILTLESCLEQEKKIYMLHSTVSMEGRKHRKSLIENTWSSSRESDWIALGFPNEHTPVGILALSPCDCIIF